MSKLDGIKPGDRVRVTFEGEFLGETSILFDGSSIGTHFQYSEFEAPTFHIEKLAPPLKVGDRVRWAANEQSTQGVIFAMDPNPVIRFEPERSGVYYDMVDAALLVAVQA